MLDDLLALLLVCGSFAAIAAMIFFMLRTFAAKSRKVYWRNMGIVLVAGLIAIIAAQWMLPVSKEAESYGALPPAGTPFTGMSPPQIGLLLAAAAVWLVGGNVVVIRSVRRAGRPWWQALNPLNPPFRDLRATDVVSLGCLAVLAMGLMIWAAALGQGSG